MRLWCDDPDEERRQARSDFRNRGEYGYDRERDRYGDECDRVYMQEFDRLREDARDERRREEEREERQAQERRAEYRRQEEAQMDEAYLYEQQQYEQEPEPEEPMP
jgi:hypothetical protein